MKKLFLLLILFLIFAAGYWGYKNFSQKPEIKVLETAKVEKGKIRAVLVETGIVKPQVGARVKIGARATGEIIEMRVKVGGRVKKGEVIACIDNREIIEQIEQTKAGLLSKRHRLRQVKLTYPELIKEAAANYEYAKIEYNREKGLILHDYTTRDAVDLAKSRFEATEAVLKRFEEEYETQAKIVKADVKELEARLEQQKIRLSYTKIIAPIDGVVSDLTAQKGETVVTGLQVANLVTVLDTRRLEMWIYVDETDIGNVVTGQNVQYYVDTFPDRTFYGSIEKIYPQPVSRENITYYLAIVKIAEDDADFLRPEMTTYVKIIFDEKNNVLTIANAAVKFEKGKQIAYKVTGPQTVEKIELKTGIRGEDKSEILSGAKQGDTLAVKLILPISGKPKH